MMVETIPEVAFMDSENLDFLLSQVIKQARSMGIPVSRRIDPHVVINTRARTRFGCCRTAMGQHTIEVSAALLNGEEQAVRQVLAHEILHTCPGCANHGVKWQRWADMMSRQFGYRIRRTTSHKALGLEDSRPVRYVVVCERCGNRTNRMKRSPLVDHPERYRCKCGGRLTVEIPGDTTKEITP